MNLVTARVEPNVVLYSSTISACQKGQELELALELFVEMQSLRILPHVQALTAIASACQSCGEWELALLMLHQAKTDKHVKLDIVIYNSVMTACANAGEWQRSLALYDELQTAGLVPTDVTCRVILAASRQAGSGELARGLLQDMQASRQQPDSSAYNSAMAACSAEQWEEASELLRAMFQQGLTPSHRNFVAGLGMGVSVTQWVSTLRLLREILQRRLNADVAAFTEAVSACGDATVWERSLALHRELEISWGITPDLFAFNAVVMACERGHQHGRAQNLLQDLRSQELTPDAVTFHSLISCCAKTQEWESAQAFLAEMRRELPWSEGRDLTMERGPYVAMMGLSGFWDKALWLLQELRTAGLEPDIVAHNACISACEKGRWQPALQILRSLQRSGSLEPDVVTFTSLISSCRAHRRWASCLGLLGLMRREGVTPNALTLSSTLMACESAYHSPIMPEMLLETEGV
ncbi:unnamed protein product, partial [Polarella glacialis]